MQLQLGIMTNDELAEWFRISSKTLRNQKKKRLVELQEYAEFEELRGKVKILSIKEPEYINKKDKNYDMVKQGFINNWDRSINRTDVCKRVAEQTYIDFKQDLSIKESTVYRETLAVRNQLYGKPFIERGEKGVCRYVWCKYINKKCVLFTEEEQKIYDDLKFKYFKGADEKQMFVQDMVDRGEITKEEAWSVLADMTGITGNFMLFKGELEMKLGCQIIRGTQLEDIIEWNEDK